MIVFDLEWNSGYFDKITLHEILQIGAVKLDDVTGELTDTFTVCIRPCVHKRYAPPVKKLPDLAAFEASDLDFRTAVEMFARWCGGEARFAVWGPDDFPVLLQNLRYWGAAFPVPETYIDVQLAFAMTVGAGAQVSLQNAIAHCGLPDTQTFHSAVNDAAYTARVLGCIDAGTLDKARRTPGGHSSRRRSRDLPQRDTPWTGPFEDVSALLNSRGSRLAVCPDCGRKCRVSCWHYTEGGPYYARFGCPDHGAHILKLSAVGDKSGHLWAGREVLAFTEENKACLREAKQAQTFRCAAASQKSGKRRCYRRSRRTSPV